jgi:cell division initiation protein
MKLTPLDLHQKTFKKVSFGGLDAAEVQHFLAQAAQSLEEATRELHRLQEAVRQRDAQLSEHREREQVLQNTLTTAQKVTEDLKTSARKEAELLLSDAELQAEKIVANAQARRLQLIGEIDELKRARATFVQQLSSLVEAHKSLLEAMTGTTDPAVPKAPPAPDNVSFFAPPTKR